MHCLVYQTITTPDALMFSFYGPDVGRRHDLTLLRQSQWEKQLEVVLDVNGVRYYLYGYKAYLMRPCKISPIYMYFLVTSVV